MSQVLWDMGLQGTAISKGITFSIPGLMQLCCWGLLWLFLQWWECELQCPVPVRGSQQAPAGDVPGAPGADLQMRLMWDCCFLKGHLSPSLKQKMSQVCGFAEMQNLHLLTRCRGNQYGGKILFIIFKFPFFLYFWWCSKDCAGARHTRGAAGVPCSVAQQWAVGKKTQQIPKYLF